MALSTEAKAEKKTGERRKKLRSGPGARMDDPRDERIDEDPAESAIQASAGDIDPADLPDDEDDPQRTRVQRRARGTLRESRDSSTGPESSGGGPERGPKRPGTKQPATAGRAKSKSSGGRRMEPSGARSKKAANRKEPASGKRSSSPKRP